MEGARGSQHVHGRQHRGTAWDPRKIAKTPHFLEQELARPPMDDLSWELPVSVEEACPLLGCVAKRGSYRGFDTTATQNN